MNDTGMNTMYILTILTLLFILLFIYNKKHKTRFIMKSNDIHDLVKNMELISDHVKIQVEFDHIYINVDITT